MKQIYLILTIVGAIVPYIYFVLFLSESGFDLSRLWQDTQLNNASKFFAADLTWTAISFWVFLLCDSIRNRVRHGWIAFIFSCTIGISMALPFYLYLRENHFENIKES